MICELTLFWLIWVFYPRPPPPAGQCACWGTRACACNIMYIYQALFYWCLAFMWEWQRHGLWIRLQRYKLKGKAELDQQIYGVNFVVNYIFQI